MDKDIQKYTDIVAPTPRGRGENPCRDCLLGHRPLADRPGGRMLQRVLEKQKVDPTLMRYIGSFLAVT